MSSARGREVFEGPSEKELEEYIKKGRQSIKRMEKGKPPLLFKPKKSYSKILPVLIILILIPTSLFILTFLLSANDDTTSIITDLTVTIISPVNTIQGTEMVNISLTGNAAHFWYYIAGVDTYNKTWVSDTVRPLPDGTYTLHAYGNDTKGNTTHVFSTFTVSTLITEQKDNPDLMVSINEVEDSIDLLIGSNYSVINTFIVNGTVNSSLIINITELLDLIWMLSQFEEQSFHWNLGRNLLFETYPFWNSSILDDKTLTIQLKALRCLLSYSEEDITINPEILMVFQNKCSLLWNQTKNNLDIHTSTIIEPSNNSIRNALHQICFIEILASAVAHPSIFELSELQSYANNVLETIDQLTNITKGIPNQFSLNSSWTSYLYKCQQQGELFIALNYISNALAVRSTSQRIQDRLNAFINGFLLSAEGKFFENYNTLVHEPSINTNIFDQALITRCNIILKFPTSANNAIEGLIDILSETSTFYLLDQVQALLAFQEFIEFESSLVSETYPSPVASFWGIEILFIGVLIFTLIKKHRRKKMNKNVKYRSLEI
ncbi:MAG: hypothetical protein ACFFAU_09255 [Candidatus Hodarchaeota archaeon]